MNRDIISYVLPRKLKVTFYQSELSPENFGKASELQVILKAKTIRAKFNLWLRK